MADKQNTKEHPPKRSLTPNRSLYTSFNEAHRNIAPPTPKLPFETDLGNEEPLTPEQVENILTGTNQSKGSQELEHPYTANQADHNTNLTSPSSLSAIESRSKTTDHGNHVSGSVYGSDDEHAFIDTSASSFRDSKTKINQNDPDLDDDTLASQHAADNFPDASSFYPEDGANYSPDVSVEEFIPVHVRLEPRSSPILASLPILPPPVATSSHDPSQQMSQSHVDDITKKQPVSDYFDTTHLSGQNGTQYPLCFDHGSQSTSCDPGMPLSTLKNEIKTESQYDGDVSGVSDDGFMDQDKGKASSSRLNPFHAFSAASSTQESEVNFEHVQPDTQKLFLRPQVEKEISRALHHATGISQPSSGLIVGRTRPSHANASDLHISTIKKGKEQQEGFYHAPAIQPSWQVNRSGVKVPVPIPYTGNDEVNMRETEPYNAIDSTNMATMASTADERTGLDADEDWRTVTDDREDFPAGAMGRVMTGSSIANVSDRILLGQQSQYQGRRAPSTTTAWWDRRTPMSPVDSPTVPFPAIGDLPTPPAPTFARRQKQPVQYVEIELEPMPSPWDRARSQSSTAEPQLSGGQYANLPFPLVSREDAARIQAVRRASGIEDQTLSGRVTSNGLRSSSIQDSSHFLPRPAYRKDSARSVFSRINNTNSNCRTPWTPTQNPFQRPANEFYSSELAARPRASTTDRGLITSRAAASALATRQRDSRPASPHLVPSGVVSRYEAFQAVRNAGGRGTDSELADMAVTIGDAALSPTAQRRQRIYYRVVMAVTFFAPVYGWTILLWRGDGLLLAITHGECSGLSYHQRRNLRMMVLGGFALWCITVAVTLIATASLD